MSSATDVPTVVADHTLRPSFHFDALIADLESRILPVPDAHARFDTRERPGLEAALEFQRGAACATPRKRNGQPFLEAEEIHSTRAPSIGEAVSISEADDRQEHQLAS